MSKYFSMAKCFGFIAFLSVATCLTACKTFSGADKDDLEIPTVQQRALTGDVKVKEFFATTHSTQGIVYEPGDFVEIDVFNEVELSGAYPVDSFGNAAFPYIGTVKISGLNEIQAQQVLNEQYSHGYFQKPNVVVRTLQKETGYVVVDGEVSRPGIIEMVEVMHLSEVLARAGGLSDEGDEENVYVLRENEGKKDLYRVNIADVRIAQAVDPVLLPTDVVIVQKEGEKFDYLTLLRFVPLANLALIVTSTR